MTGCVVALMAEGQRPSLLEQIAQPKVTFQSDFLSDAKFEGYEGSVKTSKQKIQINNDMLGISYSRWDFDWNQESDLPFYKGKINETNINIHQHQPNRMFTRNSKRA